MVHNPNQLKQLKATWKKKLKESGFEDIEEEKNGVWHLKQHSQGALKRYDENHITQQAKSIFYETLSIRIGETSFPNELEEQIMMAYSEGITQAEIKRRMMRLGIKRHRETIYKIIYKYLRQWGLKPQK